MQRFCDIIFSFLALAILSPLLLAVSTLLRLTGEGEIIFSQQRVGRGGKLFKVHKFATMLKNSPNMGPGTVTLHKDPRILPLGGILRKTKINELPQLINILTGDMSLIGPRPQTQRCFDAFSESTKERVTQVRPGLSGIGSIIFRNEELMMQRHSDPDGLYDKSIMPYKGALEEWYIENQSTKTYFLLLLSTILVVLIPKANQVLFMFEGLPTPPKELNNWL
jgi:lipopolysaccharide/colanic/teichoic acid biosynthesis glycosyltransferase